VDILENYTKVRRDNQKLNDESSAKTEMELNSRAVEMTSVREGEGRSMDHTKKDIRV
jgi:hypothetical protein